MAVWCDRCDKRFNKFHALRQHIQDSWRHYECPKCEFDGCTWDELLDHCRDSGCRTVCQGCNDGTGTHWRADSDAYWEHVQDFNVCTKCERHFESNNNLEQHRLIHRAANLECLGCERMFTTYGGMMIHLESGACDSGIDKLDLNATAAECRKWFCFIDEDYREDMLDHWDMECSYFEPIFPYKCPTCATSFPKLSSLFQHTESPACEQTLDGGAIGQLRRFLRSRYD